MKPEIRSLSIGRRLLYGLLLVIFIVQLSGCDNLESELNADKTVWYVSTTGSDKNLCHTAANPCRNIATAISRAAKDDTIHIADGSYYEQLTLTKALKIYGTSMANTIIDAQMTSRPLTLDGSSEPNGFNLELKDVTLTGGAVGEGGGFYIERGYYIVLTNVEIRNNVGHTAGGGIYSDNTSRLYLVNVSIHDNHTSSSTDTESKGGGIFFGTGEVDSVSFPAFAELHVEGSHIYNNNAYEGGGIFNEAKLSVSTSVIEKNTAGDKGGGIFNAYDATISKSRVNKNTALVGGGIFAGTTFGGIIIPGTGIYYTEITGNTAKSGAGIANTQSMALNNSTVWGNTASIAGGGVLNVTDLEVDEGGGKWAGRLMAMNSTISNNSAVTGGGIMNGNATEYAKGGMEGTNLTIANNIGGGLYFHFGTLILTNVLLSENDGKNCDFAHDVTLITSLSSDDTCPGFIVADAAIRDLADNGGYTLTHALLPGSPARDAGTQIPGGLYTDQREYPRPVDGDGDGVAAIDIGAFEADYQVMQYKTLQPIVTVTPTPARGGIFFTPDANPPCREGPATLYRTLGILEKGRQYPITGQNQDHNWLFITLDEKTKCWVSAGSGTFGDISGVVVIPVTVITVTPTLAPIICDAFTSADTCNMHPECSWETGNDVTGKPWAKCSKK